MGRPANSEATFWSRVSPEPNTGCWLWVGTYFPSGYGAFKFGDRSLRAHRAAWELTHGPIPGSRVVCHRCDQPACVHPEHLFLGTQADNIRDRHSKIRDAVGDRHGRSTKPHRTVRGEGHGCARLTESGVASIRRQYGAGGIYLSELAALFDVSTSTIHRAVTGQTWR